MAPGDHGGRGLKLRLLLRRDLSRLVAGGYPPQGGRRLLHKLCHLYSKFAIVSDSTFSVAVETLKQRVSSFATRLRRYKIRLQRYWQNTSFQRNERKFYSELLQSKHDGLKPPELSQLELFWKGIFEKNSEANLQAPWLLELQSQLACKSYSTEAPVIDHHCFKSCLKRLRNWAAPGPDGIQGFWIKKFSALHSVLINHYSTMLKDGTRIPVWFPVGRTILIPKSSDTTVPKNFRPITCLNVLYKLWTACLTELLMTHCTVNDILHPAQKGCARNQLGCTDHLLLNSRIWHQVKSKNRSLSVAWLDYRKAYDSVPHNWILFCLQLFHFHPVIVQCIAHLVPLWSTTLYLNMLGSAPREISATSVRCGIFQGDTLSPLLFCITLTPLSLLLDHLDGYHTKVAGQLNHLLYMDDLKLFAGSDRHLETLLRTVHMFSADVGLTFGLDKCAKLSVVRGKFKPAGDAVLPAGINIRELSVGETYKYLGLFEAEGLDCSGSKKTILEVYLKRLSLSFLSGPRKVRATFVSHYCRMVLELFLGLKQRLLSLM